MSEIIGIKLNSASSTNLGYVQALAVKHGATWEQGNITSVPNNGQIFVYSRFDVDIHDKFEFGELFLIDANHDDDGRTCKYSATGKDVRPLSRAHNFSMLFEINKTINATDELNIKSPVKPSGNIFFIQKTPDSSSEVIGPFDVQSSLYDQTNRTWQTTLRPFTEVPGLDNFHIYKTPFELLPEENIIPLDNVHYIDGTIFLGINILEDLAVMNAPSEPFVEPKTILNLLDDAFPVNMRLGRKGRREALQQLSALKKINPLIKSMGQELIQEFDQRDEIINRFVSLGEMSPNDAVVKSAVIDGALEEKENQVNQLKEKLAEVESAYKNIKRDYDIIFIEYENLKASEETDNVTKLNEKIEALEAQINKYETKEELDKEIEFLGRDKDRLAQEKQNFEQLIGELKADIERTDQQFIAKAASVLPFLGVLNQRSSEQDVIEVPDNEPLREAVSIEPENLLNVISERIMGQGYMANHNFLACATSMFFASRFTGLFGEPGTGKTTLARAFARAIGGNESNQCFVNVGKGWSSSADFIGYKNPFADRFDFKNRFFTRFRYGEPYLNENAPVSNVIFDEASLSSIDSYLSDFMSIHNADGGFKLDELSIGGTKFYIPSTTNFIMTFNFDENTESLPRKLLDRMPIIHCEAVSNAENAVIEQNAEFDPIMTSSIVDFLQKQAHLRVDGNSKYSDVCDDINQLWSTLITNGLGARRKAQMEMFVQLASNYDDLDEGYVAEFFARSFLLPLISGAGSQYDDALSAVIEKSEGLLKSELQKLQTNGQYFGSYRYI